MPKSQLPLTTFSTFGDLLKYLRRRARLTQRDLSIAVGYSEAQISRLETNRRSPEMAAVKALFVPALGIDDEPEVIARLTELAAGSHNGERGSEVASRESDKDISGANAEELIGESLKRTHNLPVQLTSFIGRGKEIADLVHLLHSNRLVTIHGSGGTGKTRLSEEVAAHVLESYPDGVWLVELAPLTDAEKIPQLINTTLGLVDSRSRSALDQLVDFFSDKHMLLLLDNCEHLIDACARLADRLLQACPQLSLLATSREALGVTGETTFRVPSLSIPEPKHTPPFDEITRFEAVRLFAERAASIQPGFLVTEANALAVVQICRRLDGIPLAIELAAGRMDLLSPEQIAARLDKRFRLLTGGIRTALPRQQTLRASIDWSYSLLTESERLLLQRLSVFAGGWTLEAAEGVCGFDGLEDFEVLDGLGQLVKKSLVVADSQVGFAVRYRLLETIRQYAREKLLDAGTGVDVRTRHLNYYLELAEQAEPHLRGPDQVDWLDRLEAEIDNLRAALEWSGEDQVEKGLRIATSLKWFWHARVQSYQGVITDWLDRFLTAYPTDEELPQKRMLVWANALALRTVIGESWRDKLIVAGLYEKSRELYEKLGPLGRHGLVYLVSGWAVTMLMSVGDRASFRAMMGEALSIAEELGDKFGIADCLALGNWTDNLSEKIQIARRGLAIRREIGDLEGIWWDLLNLARLYFGQGDYTQALQLIEEGVIISQQVKNRFGLSLLLFYQGWIYTEMGRFAEAITRYERSVQLNLDLGFRDMAVVFDIGLASLFQKLGDAGAAQLHFRNSLAIARKEGYSIEQARIQFSQGEIAWSYIDYPTAEECYRETMAIGQENNSETAALGLFGLGKVMLKLGDRSAAWDYFRQALQTWMRFGATDYLSYVLEAMAVLAASTAPGLALTTSAANYAAHLQGAGQALSYLSRLTFYYQTHFEPYDMAVCLAPARAVLGEDAYAHAFAEGQAMKLEQAVEYALNYEGV